MSEAPYCYRCGHSAREHGHTFCVKVAVSEMTGTLRECDCPGYRAAKVTMPPLPPERPVAPTAEQFLGMGQTEDLGP